VIADSLLCGWVVLVTVWFFAPYLGVVAPEPVGRIAYLLVLLSSIGFAVLGRRTRKASVSGGAGSDE